ncbi:hypothetical protein HY045_02465 [Candidatus Woesebacteria bacterium]|nr:hypothetical protein [Candidatus Woesebacteria bacterium]
MQRILRQREIKLRKNFLPALVLTLFLWAVVGFIVYFTDPTVAGIVPLFFLVLFIVFVFTFSLIFASKKRGLIVAIAFIVFLILRYFGIGNLINFLLIMGLVVSTEFYLNRQ